MSRHLRVRSQRRAFSSALALASLLSFATSATAQTAAPDPVPAAAPAPAAGPAEAPNELPPRADGRAVSVCGTEPLEPLAAKVGASVVEVEGPLAWALGFVYGEPDLVVVPGEVARAGRGVLVHRDGRAMKATIAAYDEASNLALLRVPELHATPLSPSTTGTERGAAALVLGQAWDEDAGDPTQLSPGTITESRASHFRTSARVSYGFTYGAPVIDCFGRVLGAATWMPDDAITIDRADALLRRVRAGAEPYTGGVTAAPAFRALLELDDEPWGGGELGVSLVHHDRWEIGAHGRILGTGEVSDPDPQGVTRERWGIRGGVDLRAGARLMLTDGAMPLYLVPQIGVGFDVSAQGGRDRRSQIEGDGCSPEAPCPVVGDAHDLPTRTELHAGPTAGLAFRFGPLDVGYTFRLDATDVADSTHQIGLGVSF
jgi:hypothetical protein